MYSVAKLFLDHTFLSFGHPSHVAALCMVYKVNSNSNHCLFSELPSASVRDRHTKLRLHLIHYSLKYQGVEHPNLQGVSCRPRLLCGMTFLTLFLTPER